MECFNQLKSILVNPSLFDQHVMLFTKWKERQKALSLISKWVLIELSWFNPYQQLRSFTSLLYITDFATYRYQSRLSRNPEAQSVATLAGNPVIVSSNPAQRSFFFRDFMTIIIAWKNCCVEYWCERAEKRMVMWTDRNEIPKIHDHFSLLWPL